MTFQKDAYCHADDLTGIAYVKFVLPYTDINENSKGKQ